MPIFVKVCVLGQIDIFIGTDWSLKVMKLEFCIIIKYTSFQIQPLDQQSEPTRSTRTHHNFMVGRQPSRPEVRLAARDP